MPSGERNTQADLDFSPLARGPEPGPDSPNGGEKMKYEFETVKGKVQTSSRLSAYNALCKLRNKDWLSCSLKVNGETVLQGTVFDAMAYLRYNAPLLYAEAGRH